MRNEILDDFNNKVIKEAIKQVDVEKMAKVLASKIEAAMTDGFNNLLENGFDFEYWLSEELTNEKTASGKAFKNAISSISKRMAEAI